MGYYALIMALVAAALVAWRGRGRGNPGTPAQVVRRLRGWGVRRTAPKGAELRELVSLAGAAVFEQSVPIGDRTLWARYVSLCVPPRLEPVVRAAYTDLAQLVTEDVKARWEAAGYLWAGDMQVQLNTRVWRGELAAIAGFELPRDGNPFVGPEQPATPSRLEFVSGSSGAEGAGRSTAVRTPEPVGPVRTLEPRGPVRTPEPVSGPVINVVVDGRVQQSVRAAVAGSVLGHDVSCQVRLPLREGLSGQHVMIAACGDGQVEVTDVSRYGTSLKDGSGWRTLRKGEPVLLNVPVTLRLAQCLDVSVEVVAA